MNPIVTDVLVIGAGAAGVAAARAARDEGARVAVVSLAAGASGLTSGVVWGHASEPFNTWAVAPAFRLGGRYVTVAGWVIPRARGAIASLLDLASVSGMLGVVDVATHPSWSAKLVAETLGARIVRAPSLPVEETFRETAARLDTEAMAEGIAAEMRAECEGLAGVLFPPVLGLRRDDVAARMSRVLGIPVGETAGGAGDPPGVRFERALQRWLPDDVRVVRARATVSPASSSALALLDDGNTARAKAVVLATGGLAGGGLVFDGALREATAGAPVWTRSRERVLNSTGAARGADPCEWFSEGAPRGVGVRVDASRRVLDVDGVTVLAPWLFAAGEVATSLEGEGFCDALDAGARAGVEAARHARGA